MTVRLGNWLGNTQDSSTEVTRSGLLFWQSNLGTMWEMEQPDTRRPGRRQHSQRRAWGNHTERKAARRNAA